MISFQNVIDLCFSEYLFSIFIAGLESYMVHSQPWLNPVFPEHSACVGPLHLPVVGGPFLLSSSVLPRPWTYSNVQPLHYQNGENWVILSEWGRSLTSTLGGRHLILFSKWTFVEEWSCLLVCQFRTWITLGKGFPSNQDRGSGHFV